MDYTWGGYETVSYSGQEVNIKAESYEANDRGYAYIVFDTDEVSGNSDGLYVTSGDTNSFRALFDYTLYGAIDSSSAGNEYSYLKVELRIYYYEGGQQTVGSDSHTFTSGSYSGSTHTLQTSSGYVPTGEVVHAEIKITVQAEGTWSEANLENDFNDGSNRIELGELDYQRYVWY